MAYINCHWQRGQGGDGLGRLIRLYLNAGASFSWLSLPCTLCPHVPHSSHTLQIPSDRDGAKSITNAAMRLISALRDSLVYKARTHPPPPPLRPYLGD